MRASPGRLAERAIMAAGIACLWPWVFGYRGGWYLWTSLAVALLLLWVAVRRVARLRREFHALEEARRADGRDPGGGRPG
ncbi:MAG: hypothetical protein JXR94_18425 [Candidatus Hydrogenedentes bacterium]|nr:hypothetical protein [Candidatus Hydrogenedentota bacterium]